MLAFQCVRWPSAGPKQVLLQLQMSSEDGCPVLFGREQCEKEGGIPTAREGANTSLQRADVSAISMMHGGHCLKMSS